MRDTNNNGMVTSRIASRRRFLQAVGGLGAVGLAGMSGPVSAQEEIVLEGETTGWEGVAPDDIEGETNPALSLVPDEDYVLEWTNADGQGHNFAIVDDDEDVLLSSEIITGVGSTQTVEFTATREMSEYLCEPHPQAMRGDIAIEGEEEEEEDEAEEEEEEPTDWTKTQLIELDNAMKMDIAPDGRVFYITRGSDFDDEAEEGTAEIGVIDPDTDDATTALELDVNTFEENGGHGVAIDPDFEDNGWVYLYYSALDDTVNRLSRFTVEGDTIDPNSEVEILTVDIQRETCCHHGGDIEFDSVGNLYLSTGDNTNPFESEGYAPLDEREGNEYIDAQRTSGNTADLRGKILRITPEDDGSYSIPEDNLFTEEQGYAEEIDEGLAREEIYVMGLRNPFTMEIDHETDCLYYADYGEGADEWSEERGSIGLVQFDRTHEAQNSGWPYFIGPNYPYIEYDFETGESGEPFDPENPINDSPNNTGLEELPPAQPMMLWYPLSWENYLDAPDYVELAHGPDEIPWPGLPEGSGAPMTGPVYHYEDAADGAMPEEYDGHHLIADWLDNWMATVEYRDGEVHEIEPFLADEEFESPMDMEISPDGVLYLMEYGEGYDGRGGGISRIEYQA